MPYDDGKLLHIDFIGQYNMEIKITFYDIKLAYPDIILPNHDIIMSSKDIKMTYQDTSRPIKMLSPDQNYTALFSTLTL